VLKQYIYPNRPRPWALYSKTDIVHLVPGFTPYTNNSFPSGHTATAFCMAAILACIYPRLKLGWLFMIMALMVGYSRIYLSQHFFMDVYFGSMIGTVSAFVFYYYFYRQPIPGQPLKRIDMPLLKLKR
jgi:membrane-associated phospholipid phosphatase